MHTNSEPVREVNQRLEEEIVQRERALQLLVETQAAIKNIEVLAESIIEYERIEKEIEDRVSVFAFVSAPHGSMRNPFVKAECVQLMAAAAAVDPELAHMLSNAVLAEARVAIESQEDVSTDLIQTEFKEYILPGKLLAGRFEEVDGLLNEMNRFCIVRDHRYTEDQTYAALAYAFQAAIDASTHLEPLATALREQEYIYLKPEDRAQLVAGLDERRTEIQFEAARKTALAMDKAIAIMEQREQPEE